MTLPNYINTIVHSHLKNKELESVRTEIKSLLALSQKNPFLRDHLEFQRAVKSIEPDKSLINFYNPLIILGSHADQQYYPLKTFSQMHINKLRTRLTVPINAQSNTINQGQKQLEGEDMSQWRKEMMKHIKPKKTLSVCEKQEIQQALPAKFAINQFPSNPLSPQQEHKKMFTVKSPYKRMFKSNSVAKMAQKEPSDHKRIILIKPQLITQEEKKSIIRSNSTKKKSITLQKFNFKKDQSSNIIDEISLQRLANFNALLPFLAAQKAKVQGRQNKEERTNDQKYVMKADKQRLFKNDIKMSKKAKIKREEIFQIQAWETAND